MMIRIIEITEEPVLRQQDFIIIKEWNDFEFVALSRGFDVAWHFDGTYYLIGPEVSFLCKNRPNVK